MNFRTFVAVILMLGTLVTGVACDPEGERSTS